MIKYFYFLYSIKIFLVLVHGKKKRKIKEKKKVMGQIKIKASKVFVLDNALYELEEQQTKFPLNVGYAVHKMSKQISGVTEYISNRLFAVIDEERMRLGNMTDEEQVIYNTLMDSDVWIEPFDITKEELFDNKEVALALHEIAAVDELFA